LSYTYDPGGNITTIRDEAQQTIFFDGARVEPSAAYEYDPIYRLITATGREHIGQLASPQPGHDDSPRMNQPLPTDAKAVRNYKESYEYDPVGNVLRILHAAGARGSWTRRYDHEASSNRLHATSLPGDGEGVFSAKYEYDVHGNMTSMPHLPVMEWDFKDQLRATQRQVVNDPPPGEVTEKTYYVYDAAGQRVRKVTETQKGERKDERIYIGNFELYRKYNGSGKLMLERETLHIMDDKQRTALVETKTRDSGSEISKPQSLIRYQLSNHLGSASLELDGAGAIISYEEYYPYGSTSYQARRSGVGVSPRRYRYTAKERDEETGLYYHGARYYAVWLGRWLSCDPAGMAEGVNLYVYGHNNPFTFADATGAESVDTVYPLPPVYTTAEDDKPNSLAGAVVDLVKGPLNFLKDPKSATSAALATTDTAISEGAKWAKEKIASPPPPIAKPISPEEASYRHIQETVGAEVVPIPSGLAHALPLDIRTKEHYDNVVMVVNHFIEYGPGRSVTEKLQSARDKLSRLREKSTHNSESLILRDAERYLWARAGIPFFSENHGWAYSTAIETLAPAASDVYNIAKPLALAVNDLFGTHWMQSDVNRPLAAVGGGSWFSLGIGHYHEFDKSVLDQRSQPRRLSSDDVLMQERVIGSTVDLFQLQKGFQAITRRRPR
jgi:RHS repeat-associated protein